MAHEEKEATGTRRVEHAITIRRRPRDVYDAWRNIETFPRFMENLVSVEEEGATSHWIVKAPGGVVEWDAEVIIDIPGERIAWRSVGDTEVRNSGEVILRRAPQGIATEMRVILNWDPPGGALGSAVARLSGDHPKRQVAKDLMRFKQLMETGDIPTTAGQPVGEKQREDEEEKAPAAARGRDVPQVAWTTERPAEARP